MPASVSGVFYAHIEVNSRLGRSRFGANPAAHHKAEPHKPRTKHS